MTRECRDVTDILQPSDGREPRNIDVDGTIVPVRFRYAQDSKKLLISFHGAVDREKRTPPVFPAILPGLGSDVAQLSVSDPSMMLDGAFGMSWYAGHEGFHAQDLLAKLFQDIVEAGQFERVVFFGSSGGGFASLFFSSLLPESIALTAIPQTNMFRYYSGHIKRYREGCWPSLSADEQLTQEICTDLCEWYSTLRPNTVIYLQSAGDHFHTRTQFLPFMAAIARVKNSRFLANSGYWGKLGHSGAVPPEAYMPWVRAALMSPSTDVDDLLAMHHRLADTNASVTPSNAGVAKSDTEHTASDLRFADLLRDHFLRHTAKG